MFMFLESKQEIATAQKKLERTIRRDFSKRVVRDIGYPGGRISGARVHTNGQYWFWSSSDWEERRSEPRYFNWFGRFRESPGSSISVEVNPPIEGRNDQTAGFFARDSSNGAVYLMHSGRVGGGQKGVGKKEFCAWYGERLIEVVDSSGKIRQGLIVMPVEGAGASRSVVRYVEKVDQFKLSVKSGEIDTPSFRRRQRSFEDFYAEGRGRRKGRRSSKIDYISRHGEIVDALHMWRKGRSIPKGARIVKNVLIDMGFTVGDKLVEVFEVKPSAARSDIYSALGQLMVHGATDNSKKIIVLPVHEPLAHDLSNALALLKIEILRFSLNKSATTIIK